MSRPDPPPELSPQEYQEKRERDAGNELAYWADQDREDAHAPAPDVRWFCKAHGWHRHILGCPVCEEKKAA